LGEKRRVTIDGETFEVDLERQGAVWKATVEGQTFEVEVDGESAAPPPKRRKSGAKAGKSGVISSNIPGKVMTIEVELGQSVSVGDIVLILEAMKMQNEVTAPVSGTVTEINCTEGANIKANTPLVVIQPVETGEGSAQAQ
jgi:biotin carboxyl carrier protein